MSYVTNQINFALYQISTFLGPEEVQNSSQTCKLWQRAFDNPRIWKVQYTIQGYTIDPEIEVQLKERFPSRILKIITEYHGDYKRVFTKGVRAFGSKAWNIFHGEGAVPHIPRPANMRQFNNEPCPYFPEKRRGETGMWTLKTEKVHKKALSIYEHERLTKTARSPGYRTQFHWGNMAIMGIMGGMNESIDKTRWLYMTFTTISKSLDKTSKELEQMVQAHGDRLPTGPEAIHSLFAEHVQFGTYPFPKERWISTCTSTVATYDNRWNWSIGFFDEVGLRVNLCDIGSASALSNAAAMREFPAIVTD